MTKKTRGTRCSVCSNVTRPQRTRAAVRSSICKASTISDEEHWLALTEDNFLAIQWEMDKIDKKLIDLYRNWQVEYKNAYNSRGL